MKLISLIFLVLTIQIAAQVGYVEYTHPVYGFLQRMDSYQILKNYDGFELPKTRKQIAGYLKEIISAKENLSPVDLKILNDFITEFEYELRATTEKFSSVADNGLKNVFSQKENFVYYFTEKNKFSAFINFVGDATFFNREFAGDSVETVSIFNFGGVARISFQNHLGFSIKATNGTFAGNRYLAQSTGSRKYNFKIHTNTSSNLGNDFFDETEGYFMAEYDNATFKIGRDRKIVGFLNYHPLLSDYSPPIDYIQLNLKYKNFGFSFFHGKLLGTSSIVFDSGQTASNVITDKYIAYHRFYYNFSKHLKLGAGEIIVYSKRGIDFSYLNPFNFYKSAEHANQDRDNSMLFFDFTNNTFNRLKFYGTLLIDDIDFGKLGTGWYGNQTLLHLGIFSSQLFPVAPVEFEIDYLRIDPYVFSHRLNYNNYTSLGYGIGVNKQPNSSTFGIKINYYPHYRIRISAMYDYTVHGANKVTEGSTINYGGNILLGHRLNDSEEVYFLQGVREYSRNLKFDFVYEPYNNLFLFLSLNYTNESLQGNISRKIFDSQTGLRIKI